MGPLFSGQLVGILSSVLGVLLIVYIKKGREYEKDRFGAIEAYLVDMQNITDKEDYRIDRNVTTIGRMSGKDIDMRIARNTISASHAQIEHRNGKFYLTDLRSRNGTYLNGEKEKITSEVYLMDGDTITFDKYMFRFVVPDKERKANQTDGELHGNTIMRTSVDQT